MVEPRHEQLCLPLACRIWEKRIQIQSVLDFIIIASNPYHPVKLMHLAPHFQVIDILCVISSYLFEDPNDLKMASIKTVTDDPLIQKELIDLSFAVIKGDIYPMHIYESLWNFVKPRTPKWNSFVLGYYTAQQRGHFHHRSEEEEKEGASKQQEYVSEVELFPEYIGQLITEMNGKIETLMSNIVMSKTKPSVHKILQTVWKKETITTVSMLVQCDIQRSGSSLTSWFSDIEKIMPNRRGDMLMCLVQARNCQMIVHTRWDQVFGIRRVCLTKLFDWDDTEHGHCVSLISDDQFHFDQLIDPRGQYNETKKTEEDHENEEEKKEDDSAPSVQSLCEESVRKMKGWIHLVVHCDVNSQSVDPSKEGVFINGIPLNMVDINTVQRIDEKIEHIRPFNDYLSIRHDPTSAFPVPSYLFRILLSGSQMKNALEKPERSSFRPEWCMLDFYIVEGKAEPHEFGYLGIRLDPKLIQKGRVIIGYYGNKQVEHGLIRAKRKPGYPGKNVEFDCLGQGI